MPLATASPALALLAQVPSSAVLQTVFMYGAIGLIFYFLLLRPQQQQRKRHEETIRQLKRGDEVVTAGGIVGEVVQIRQAAGDTPNEADRITIKSGESRLVVERGRIARLASTPAASAGPDRGTAGA